MEQPYRRASLSDNNLPFLVDRAHNNYCGKRNTDSSDDEGDECWIGMKPTFSLNSVASSSEGMVFGNTKSIRSTVNASKRSAKLMKRAVLALSIDKAPMTSTMPECTFGSLDYGPAPRKVADLSGQPMQDDRSKAIQKLAELLEKIQQRKVAGRNLRKAATDPGLKLKMAPFSPELLQDDGD